MKLQFVYGNPSRPMKSVASKKKIPNNYMVLSKGGRQVLSYRNPESRKYTSYFKGKKGKARKATTQSWKGFPSGADMAAHRLERAKLRDRISVSSGKTKDALQKKYNTLGKQGAALRAARKRAMESIRSWRKKNKKSGKTAHLEKTVWGSAVGGTYKTMSKPKPKRKKSTKKKAAKKAISKAAKKAAKKSVKRAAPKRKSVKRASKKTAKAVTRRRKSVKKAAKKAVKKAAKKASRKRKPSRKKAAKKAAQKAAPKRRKKKSIKKAAKKASRKKTAKRAKKKSVSKAAKKSKKSSKKGVLFASKKSRKGSVKKAASKSRKKKKGPNKNPGGIMGQFEQYTGHSIEEAGSLALGGALYGAVNGLTAKYAKPVHSILAKVPVVGTALPTLVVGVLLNQLGKKQRISALQTVGKGLIGASVVGMGVNASQMVPGLKALSGVDYTMEGLGEGGEADFGYAALPEGLGEGGDADFGGVDYTLEGVDYTMEGDDQMGEIAYDGYGDDADFGTIPEGMGDGQMG